MKNQSYIYIFMTILLVCTGFASQGQVIIKGLSIKEMQALTLQKEQQGKKTPALKMRSVGHMAARSQPLKVIELKVELLTKDKYYSAAEPNLLYRICSGKLLGTDSLSGHLKRIQGEAKGEYAVDLGTLSAGPRYRLSLQPAIFKIIAAPEGISIPKGQWGEGEFKLNANNALSPNGDGVNDQLIIKGLEHFPTASIVITDRNGHQVYKNTHYQNDWNGRLNGQVLPAGTYYYNVSFEGKSENFKGFITLVHSQ